MDSNNHKTRLYSRANWSHLIYEVLTRMEDNHVNCLCKWYSHWRWLAWDRKVLNLRLRTWDHWGAFLEWKLHVPRRASLSHNEGPWSPKRN